MENPAAQRARKIRQRAHRRAIADILLVSAAVPAVIFLGAGGGHALAPGVVALSLGMLFIVVRRGRDAMAIARADDWRAEAVAGRGISLAEWQRGAELPQWDARRQPPAEEAGKARQDVAMEI